MTWSSWPKFSFVVQQQKVDVNLFKLTYLNFKLALLKCIPALKPVESDRNMIIQESIVMYTKWSYHALICAYFVL